MLSKSRCPHTGVVNYFADADPLLAVGSVAKADKAAGYAWRCYVGEEAGGLAPDVRGAEARLEEAIARSEYLARAGRRIGCADLLPSLAAAYWRGYNEAARKPAA